MESFMAEFIDQQRVKLFKSAQFFANEEFHQIKYEGNIIWTAGVLSRF